MTTQELPIYGVPLLATADIPPAKISVEELERLRQRAIEHREEGPYFRALLEATVYAHAPLSDDSGRVRFIQFPHPDTRKDTLPFFTDIEQARQAAQGQVKVLAMPGRLLFELSFGALLMLNPNRDAVMLYPEEIRGLLESGWVAPVEAETLKEPMTMAFGPPQHAPSWLAEWLRSALLQLPYIETAYLLDASPPEDPTNVTVLIAAAVAPEHFERTGRAISTLLDTCASKLTVSVDVMPYDPKSNPAQWLHALGVEPVYERSPQMAAFADNPLERKLQEVRRDPAQRPGFYRQLLDSDVLVPVQASHHDGRRGIIPAGSDLDVITLIRSDGVGVIPFFTSPMRLYQWSLAGEQCVLLLVRELFESRSDMHFHLNPHSPDSQEFTPAQVQALLASPER